MTVNMIWANSANGVIGVNGGIPWHVKEDFQYFKELTLGGSVIMGRNTWDSLPKKPLPGRQNIVITRDVSFNAEGAVVVHSVNEALAAAEYDVWVIGGKEIYDLFMDKADSLYPTTVLREIDVRVGDVTYAPFVSADSFEPSGQRLIVTEDGEKVIFSRFDRIKE